MFKIDKIISKTIVIILSLMIFSLFTINAEPLMERVGEIGNSYIDSGDIKGIVITNRYTNNTVEFIDNNTNINAISTVNTTLEIKTNQKISNASINVSLFSDNPTITNFGVISINKYIEIEVDPEIKNTLEWAIIKIYYSDEEVYGIDETLLRIYYFNGTGWDPYNPPNGGVNTTENYVWANTTHFSLYGLFLDSGSLTTTTTTKPPSTPTTISPVGGGGGGGGGGYGRATTTTTTSIVTTTTLSETTPKSIEKGSENETIEEGTGMPTGEATKPTGKFVLTTGKVILGIVAMIVFGLIFVFYKFESVRVKVMKKLPWFK